MLLAEPLEDWFAEDLDQLQLRLGLGEVRLAA
jgi:hypothetical protein